MVFAKLGDEGTPFLGCGAKRLPITLHLPGFHFSLHVGVGKQLKLHGIVMQDRRNAFTQELGVGGVAGAPQVRLPGCW